MNLTKKLNLIIFNFGEGAGGGGGGGGWGGATLKPKEYARLCQMR